jgi:hypothetical protein
MQMIEWIRRLVKDLCGFSTCQTLAAPGGEGHLRQLKQARRRRIASLSLQASQKLGRQH